MIYGADIMIRKIMLLLMMEVEEKTQDIIAAKKYFGEFAKLNEVPNE